MLEIFYYNLNLNNLHTHYFYLKAVGQQVILKNVIHAWYSLKLCLNAWNMLIEWKDYAYHTKLGIILLKCITLMRII